MRAVTWPVVALALLGAVLVAAWALLLVTADRLHSTPTTVAGALSGVALTVVGQALARRLRGPR